MPRLKYRAPVKKEHKEKLDAFTFGGAWRRRSQQSLYSPMGSRMPSRRGSLARRPSYSSKRPSFSGKSRKSFSSASAAASTGQRTTAPSHHEEDSDYGSKDASRSGSIGGTHDKRFKDPHGAAKPTRLSTEVEQEGDDDVGNVGLSRVNSNNNNHAVPLGSGSVPSSPVKADSGTGGLHNNAQHNKSGIPGQDHRPFSEEDLALALKRSHLGVPTR